MLRNRLKDRSPQNIFVILFWGSVICLLLVFAFSRGRYIDNFFFYDSLDTGMDFLHSIEYVRGRVPYEVYNTLYPPLANLFFLVMYAFVPKSITNKWTENFSKSVNRRGTKYDLRTNQSTMMLYIMFVVICLFLIAAILRVLLKKLNVQMTERIVIACTFSFGILYAVERGNIILLVTAFSLFYVAYYDSENKILSELALLSLAAAAGMKLYPALLGVLLLRHRRFKQAIRAIMYGILSVIIPCIFFREKFSAIVQWIKIVVRYSSKVSDYPWAGNGIGSIFSDIARWIDLFFKTNFAQISFQTLAYIIAVFFLVYALFAKKEWEAILSLTLAMLFHSQGSYFYCMAIIPMVMFLAEENQFSGKNRIHFMLMAAMVLPFPLLFIKNVIYTREMIIHVLTFIVIGVSVKRMSDTLAVRKLAITKQ